MERQEVTKEAQEAALQRLEVWFSLNPELEKSHTLLSYDSVASTQSGQDAVAEPDDMEHEIRIKLALFSLVFGLVLLAVLTVENDKGRLPAPMVQPENVSAHENPSQEDGEVLNLEFLRPKYVPTTPRAADTSD